MNDHDLDLLIRSSLERDAARQPVSHDLHQRSVSYGKRVVRRRNVALGSAAAVMIALVVTLGLALSHHQDTAPAAPKPPTLTSVVTHVRSLPAETLPTTGNWFVALRNSHNGKAGVGAAWFAPNGTERELLSGTVVTTQADSGTQILPWSALAALPLQPADLMAGLRRSAITVPRDAVTDDVMQLMEATGRLLGEAPTSPALRAALIQGLGTTTGVQVTGTAHDLLGNEGLVLSHSAGGASYRVLVSVADGRALQVDYTSAASNDSETYLDQTAVAGDTATPPGFQLVQPTPKPSVTSAATSVAASRGLPAGTAGPDAAPAVVDKPASSAFLAAVALQTSGAAGASQLSLPSDISGPWVTELEGTLPDGTELAVGSYSGIAPPRPSMWLTGVGGQVEEVGLGDPVKQASDVREYVLHGAKNQSGGPPWTWVLLRAKATTTKVEVSAGEGWKAVHEVHGLAVIPASELSSATSRVRAFAGGASPYFTGHLAVLPAHGYRS